MNDRELDRLMDYVVIGVMSTLTLAAASLVVILWLVAAGVIE